MTQQLQNKEKCPRCGKNNLVTDAESGELFCAKCGFVIDEKIWDSGPERMFSDNTNKLSASMKSSLKRLRVWDNRSHANRPVDRNLQQAFKELHKMKEKLSLSDAIVEKAAYIYRKALEKKLVRGRSISALIAATLYASCRESETPRTLKEVSNSINITRKNLAVCYRLLLKELDLKMPVVDSVQCIARIASQIGLSEKTKRHAIKILKKAEEEKIIAGKDPMGMAASALYVASMETGENISQKTVALAGGITEVTIRNRCKTLKKLSI